MPVDEDPDRVRGLRREPVDLEGAQQGDGRVRDSPGDLGQRVEFRDRRLGEPVEPAVHALQEAVVAQPLQVDARDARRIDVARPQGAGTGQAEQFRGLGRCGGHVTKRRSVILRTDEM
jgi:hypothetical protein